MKQILIVALVLLLSLATSIYAQTAQRFELGNGLSVVALPEPGSLLVSAVLVCPLPDNASATELAEATLLNRLIWQGGSALGINIREHEYRMLALRFGGSISSQLLPDALVIQYTMPAELLPTVFKYMTVQWSDLTVSQERLKSLKVSTVSRQRAGLTSSVFNQLIPQVEKRLWSDLSYRHGSYGLEQKLSAAKSEGILQTFRKMKDPSKWTLVVSGNVDADIIKESLEQSLGTIAPPEKEEGAAPEPSSTAPELGLQLQYPANLSRNYAILAYWIPSASSTNPNALILFAEALRRSRNLDVLREELSATGKPAELNVGLELRRRAGMLYLSVSWNTDMDRGEVLDRLHQIAETSIPSDDQALTAARKSLLIRYWNRRESAALIAQWIAQREAIGIAEDDYADAIASLKNDDLESITNSLLTKDNSISLVTVPK